MESRQELQIDSALLQEPREEFFSWEWVNLWLGHKAFLVSNIKYPEYVFILIFELFINYGILHLIRFQIADALKMNPDSSYFKEVLKHFECDNNWNPNSPMEAIWIKMGEKRYKLDGMQGFTKIADKEVDKEVMEKETSGQSTGSNSNLLTMCDVVIKVENEKWSKLQARLKVAKSGKGCVAAFLVYGIFFVQPSIL